MNSIFGRNFFCRDTQEHYISYDPSKRKDQHVTVGEGVDAYKMLAIPKTPPGLSKSLRRKWREEQREKRERGREETKKKEILTQIRQNRRQNQEPSPPTRAVPPRYPSPFEAARPESPKMSQSRRLFSPSTSTRSSLGYARWARNGRDSSSSDDEFGLASAAAARARKSADVGLLSCRNPIMSC